MRHIKQFESFGDEGELWESITYKEFLVYIGGYKYTRLINFNENDIDIVKKYKAGFDFSLKGLHTSIKYIDHIVMCGNKDMIFPSWYKKIDAFRIPSLNPKVNIEVLKNDDDYYLVRISHSRHRQLGFAAINFGPLNYVCDTIEGVVDLLKEVIKQ